MASSSLAQLNYNTVPSGLFKLHSNSSNSDHTDIISEPVKLETVLAHKVLTEDLATNEQDGLLKRPTQPIESHSKVSISSPSDHSDVISDHVRLERELAHEILNNDLATKEQDDLLKRPTISYEKALQKELEYQKRIKMGRLQCSVGTSFLHKPFQEPHPNQSLPRVKRKAVCGELATETPVSNPQPEKLEEWQLLPLPQLRRPRPWHKPQHQKPPLPATINPKPLAPGSSQPLRRHSVGQKLQPDIVQAPLWCNLCLVECGNFQNLIAHYQGKRHRAAWDHATRNNMLSMSRAPGVLGRLPAL